MARPIEPTPTLEGKDAENFYKELDRVRSKEEIEQRRKMFARADAVFRIHGRGIIKKMAEEVGMVAIPKEDYEKLIRSRVF